MPLGEMITLAKTTAMCFKAQGPGPSDSGCCHKMIWIKQSNLFSGDEEGPPGRWHLS